ncbi:unnamed protein product [Mycena citricolor]|uniref:Exocyst complex component Sec8 n=1 Tax=Mycena citricolor TaxID=2018698 RepID=A0AAD2Q615_9AGAR|nr:unnamed protein product [Mycena citricolor]
MSRASPFPNRRIRSPSQSNGSVPPLPSANGTRPLQVARPPSRPTTPNNGGSGVPMSGSPRGLPNLVQGGPSRPQRSELRSRGSEYSGSQRDSIATDFSSSSRTRPNGSSSNGGTPGARPRPPRVRGGPAEDEEKSPTSLTSVMAAFQSAGTRRRQMTNGSEDFDYQRDRQEEIEAENARQQRIRDRAPGRKLGKARAGDIDAVLDRVKDGWEFVVDPDFNSVDLALELLDETSVGKDMDSFRRTKNMLSQALKGSVDKHYQAFAASLPHHASLLNHLSATQTQISEARTSLQESKDALGSKRADLVQLWARGQTLEEMMRLLDQMYKREHLKTVPDLLETLMSEKRLLQASVLLVRSLKIINKPDMLEIGAVSDLRSYLNAQETARFQALREILLDELQSHIYLKSFWCESRWAAYTPNQEAFLKVEFEDELELKMPAASPSEQTFRQSRLTRFLNELALRPNDPPHDLNDPGLKTSNAETLMSGSAMTNPESDSFAYMETLLESFAVLGKLGNALDNISQRLTSETFSLVEATIEEVEERAEFGRRGSIAGLSGVSGRLDGVYTFVSVDSTALSKLPSANASASSLRLVALESYNKKVDHEILRDLFWTLYSKLDAVAQSLRVISEVANRIGSRRDFKDSSGAKPGALFSLSEVWHPVQAEVRTLIYDYLIDESQGSVSGRNPISSINEILRENKFSRDKTKAVFRFVDTDVKMTAKVLKSHEDELTRVIKDTMPGLVQSSESAVQAAVSTLGSDDRLLGAGQHHRLVIRPDAFHVSVLFQPTLAFLERVSDVLPSSVESVRDSSTILDEFVLKVYLPQLEEKVSFLFHQAVTGSDAFLPDPLSSRLSREPLVKACASTNLMALINSLCATVMKSPFHRESYSRLILGVLIQFYQRCSDRFQYLVSVPNPQSADAELQPGLAAQWAQRSELTPCLTELMTTEESDTLKQKQLCRQETNLELDFLGEQIVQQSDLIVSVRNLTSLANLHRSISWFASELQLLRPSLEENPQSPSQLEPSFAMSPVTPLLPVLPPPSDTLHLPLSREMSLRFQALLKTYEQLAELILDTMRIDIRCRAMHYLESALRYGNYSIDREAGEPDPYVIDLNNELSECSVFVSSLPAKERQFVFVGLRNLMEETLIAGARHLRKPTPFGIQKMMRNILALQQSVRALGAEEQHTEFQRAKRYFSLFSLTPQEMLDGIRKKQEFSFDEYQLMLNLQCGVYEDGNGEGAKAADRSYSMYLIDLHGLEMENGD